MSTRHEQSHDYFRGIAWCAAILDNPDFVIRPYGHSNSGTETLFDHTLNTPDTIHAILTLYRRLVERDAPLDETRTLLQLGSGMDGHPGVCHGGVAATILDEAMGTLLALNKGLGSVGFQRPTVTAFLNTTYVRPVKTPQTVMVTARLGVVEGGKFFTEAEIVDADKVVLARAEALFVSLRETTGQTECV